MFNHKSAIHNRIIFKLNINKMRKCEKMLYSVPSPFISFADPRVGATGVRTAPLENHKNIVYFLNNTGPDALENHKATKPAFVAFDWDVKVENMVRVL